MDQVGKFCLPTNHQRASAHNKYWSSASAAFGHIRTRIIVVFKIGSFTYDPFLWWDEYVFDLSRKQAWTLSGALYPTPEKLGFIFIYLDTIGYTCDLQLW